MSRDPHQLEYANVARPRPLAGVKPLGGRHMLPVLRFIGWRMLAGGCVALLMVALWFAVSPVLAIFSPVVLMILFPELAGVSTRVRRQRAIVVLSYLEQAVRLNLPLPRMLRAAQQSEEKRTARRLGRLRVLLEDGAPLGQALPLAVPEVTPRVASLVGAAERLGELPRTLDRILGETREPPDQPQRESFGRWYPLMMIFVLILMVCLVMIYVVPKLEEIFKDFGMRLPPVSRWLIGSARAIFSSGDDFPWPFMLIVAALVAVLGGMLERIFAPPADIPRPRWLDRVVWFIPVVHGVVRDRGIADACHTIAAALRGGQPLHEAVAEAAQVRMNSVLRDRLGRWESALEAGGRADDAARRAKLPAMLCGMIGPGRGADLPTAMEFLGSYYDGRFSRSRELLAAAVVPASAVLFGGIVLFVASGMYMPIIQMMDHLTAQAMGVRK